MPRPKCTTRRGAAKPAQAPAKSAGCYRLNEVVTYRGRRWQSKNVRRGGKTYRRWVRYGGEKKPKARARRPSARKGPGSAFPAVRPSEVAVGTRMPGRDGRPYVMRLDRAGSRRWFLDRAALGSAAPAPAPAPAAPRRAAPRTYQPVGVSRLAREFPNALAAERARQARLVAPTASAPAAPAPRASPAPRAPTPSRAPLITPARARAFQDAAEARRARQGGFVGFGEDALPDPNRMRIGMSMRAPNGKTYVVDRSTDPSAPLGYQVWVEAAWDDGTKQWLPRSFLGE